MSYSLTVNGVSFPLPTQSERNWSDQVNAFFTSLSQNLLQKTGGAFTLSAEVDFGGSHGALLKYLKSKTSANIPASGYLRLDNADKIAWRNALNNGDLAIAPNGQGRLSAGVSTAFTAIASSDVFTSAGRAPIVGESVQITSFTGTGATLGASYYATNITGNTFQLYTTPAGPTLLDITADGSGSFIVSDPIVTAELPESLKNKTIVAANNVITTAASGNLAATELNAALSELQADIDTRAVGSAMSSHIANVANPHAVTKTQVGLGNVDNTSDATKNSATATLTNKTLTSPVIDSATINTSTISSYADVSESAAPPTPSSGRLRIYAKTDGKLYRKTSAGQESAIGGGLVPTAISGAATVEAGKHYLVNTSSSAFTLTLPAGSTEAAVRFSDSHETWDTYNLTVAPASGETIDNLSAGESLVCDVKRGWVELSWTGSKWSFSSLASTQTAEASATQAGTVSTGTQTFAGAKTFNDVTAFKATGGTVSAGSYAATGSWTLGPVGGLGGSTAALILQGGNLLGGSNVGDAAIKIGSGTTYGGVIQLSDLGTTTFYIDSLYNSDSAKIQFRMKTAGSAVNVGDVVGSGVWTFGDGNLPAATSCVKIKKTNAVSNRLIEGIDAATRGYIRINSAQTNLEFEGASDRRIKTEIETIENALDKITSLNPVNYRLKTGVVTTQGFIAQEFKQVFPQSVTTTDDGLGDELPAGTEPWSMSDSCLIPYLVKAIKELVARIEQIEKTR